MLQNVYANDRYASLLFKWDKSKRVLSIAHKKDIWLCELGDDFNFMCVQSIPLPTSSYET